MFVLSKSYYEILFLNHEFSIKNHKKLDIS